MGSKQQYEELSEIDFILKRPDTFIGSVVETEESVWIYNETEKKMRQESVKYVPGLLKIIDEILVNAADNKLRDETMNRIEINIDEDTANSKMFISVWNNGKGIPIRKFNNPDYTGDLEATDVLIPTKAFGSLRVSSNFNDDLKRHTGGRNGHGAKLCNIFSEKFIDRTGSEEDGRIFEQKWERNMKKSHTPMITNKNVAENFTEVKFYPELKRFGITDAHKAKECLLHGGIIGMICRRACDIAATTGTDVYFNRKRIPISNFIDFIRLFATNDHDILYEKLNDRWEIGLLPSNKEFQQISFVNNIATTSGGPHVKSATEMILKGLSGIINENKDELARVPKSAIKNLCWIFVNCVIDKPAFDSQKKEKLITQAGKFRDGRKLSAQFIESLRNSSIVKLAPPQPKKRNHGKKISSAASSTSQTKQLKDHHDEETPEVPQVHKEQDERSWEVIEAVEETDTIVSLDSDEENTDKQIIEPKSPMKIKKEVNEDVQDTHFSIKNEIIEVAGDIGAIISLDSDEESTDKETIEPTSPSTSKKDINKDITSSIKKESVDENGMNYNSKIKEESKDEANKEFVFMSMETQDLLKTNNTANENETASITKEVEETSNTNPNDKVEEENNAKSDNESVMDAEDNCRQNNSSSVSKEPICDQNDSLDPEYSPNQSSFQFEANSINNSPEKDSTNFIENNEDIQVHEGKEEDDREQSSDDDSNNSGYNLRTLRSRTQKPTLDVFKTPNYKLVKNNTFRQKKDTYNNNKEKDVGRILSNENRVPRLSPEAERNSLEVLRSQIEESCHDLEDEVIKLDSKIKFVKSIREKSQIAKLNLEYIAKDAAQSASGESQHDRRYFQKEFGYLLELPIAMLTKERLDELQQDKKNKKIELDAQKKELEDLSSENQDVEERDQEEAENISIKRKVSTNKEASINEQQSVKRKK